MFTSPSALHIPLLLFETYFGNLIVRIVFTIQYNLTLKVIWLTNNEPNDSNLKLSQTVLNQVA